MSRPTSHLVSLLPLLSLLLVPTMPLAGQELIGKDAGLLTMIPKQSLLFVERRGHTAVRDAMNASCLGELARDEAVLQFLHDSRDKIESLVVRQAMDLPPSADLSKCRRAFHALLKPFWYQSGAMYLVMNKEGQPGVGFVCLPGPYAEECRKGLDAILSVGTGVAGQSCARHAITYKTGWTTWKGVVWAGESFELPADQPGQVKKIREQKAHVLLAMWDGPILRLTTDLEVADLVGQTEPARVDLSAAADPSVQAILKKTYIPDWAFRWYVNAAALRELMKKSDISEMAAMTGLGGPDSLGGAEGYLDKLYARKTYLHCPGGCKGVLRAFQPGRSYKPALAMVPPDVTVCLAGQLDTEAVLAVVRQGMILSQAAGPRPRATQPAEPATQPALPKEQEAVLQRLTQLANASNGQAAFFATDLQSLIHGPGENAPLAVVLGLRDPAAAREAVQELIKLSGAGGMEAARDAKDLVADAKAGAKEYRKVAILRMGHEPGFRLAFLSDRLIVAMSDNTLKAAIDAALDKMGGLPAGGKAAALAEATGDGEAFFMFDLAAITKLVWPMLMPLAENADAAEHFPLASLPSTNKMVSLLGPEVAVFRADKDGLLLDSRGKVPLATKFLFMVFPMVFPFMMVLA